MTDIIVKYLELFITACLAVAAVLGALVNAGIVKKREGAKLRKLLNKGHNIAEAVKEVALSQRQVIKNKKFPEATSSDDFKAEE